MTPSVSSCVAEDDLVAFAGGAVDPSTRALVVEHLADCEACRLVLAELAREGEPAVDATANLIDGRYRKVSTIGRGAMGTVYRVRDEHLGVEVALKLVHDERTGFTRELAVGRRVSHPNVCRLHDAGIAGETPYLTMELVEGRTLADELTTGRVERQRAFEILLALARGLAEVHRQGIVHRDLKPANILIEDGTGRIVLTDFGFATVVDGARSARLVGTPSFWAPEQARGEAPTPASDVYSFGLIAFRLFTGTDYSISASRLTDVPRRFRRFVGRCLHVQPRRRWRDGAAVAAALTASASHGRPFALALATSLFAIGMLVAVRWVPDPTPTATPLPAAPSSTASTSAVVAAPAPPSPSTTPTPAEKSTLPSATSSRPRHPHLVRSASTSAGSTAHPPPSPSTSSDLLYRH